MVENENLNHKDRVDECNTQQEARGRTVREKVFSDTTVSGFFSSLRGDIDFFQSVYSRPYITVTIRYVHIVEYV